jgi:hypothetical protein
MLKEISREGGGGEEIRGTVLPCHTSWIWCEERRIHLDKMLGLRPIITEYFFELNHECFMMHVDGRASRYFFKLSAVSQGFEEDIRGFH